MVAAVDPALVLGAAARGATVLSRAMHGPVPAATTGVAATVAAADGVRGPRFLADRALFDLGGEGAAGRVRRAGGAPPAARPTGGEEVRPGAAQERAAPLGPARAEAAVTAAARRPIDQEPGETALPRVAPA